MKIEKVFGEILKEKRHELSLSQEALANNSGLHRTYISLLERGLKSPSLSTMSKLSEALEVKLSQIVADLEERMIKGAISENS